MDTARKQLETLKQSILGVLPHSSKQNTSKLKKTCGGYQALRLNPWGPLYRNKNENETKNPEQKQKRNKNTGTKTKTKQKYWKKNKQTQNTGKNSIKEDIPSSPGEYPWGPLYRN